MVGKKENERCKKKNNGLGKGKAAGYKCGIDDGNYKNNGTGQSKLNIVKNITGDK